MFCVQKAQRSLDTFAVERTAVFPIRDFKTRKVLIFKQNGWCQKYRFGSEPLLETQNAFLLQIKGSFINLNLLKVDVEKLIPSKNGAL